jgi:hypothetical protein
MYEEAVIFWEYATLNVESFSTFHQTLQLPSSGVVSLEGGKKKVKLSLCLTN